MGRIVYQQIKALSVPASTVTDVVSVLGTTTTRIKIHGYELFTADIAAEIVEVNFHRITASGSGGSVSSTEELADEDNGASVAVVRTLDTTGGADGGGFMGYQWEQLGGIGHVFTPEMRPVSLVSQGFALTWEPAVAATVSGFICWEEI